MDESMFRNYFGSLLKFLTIMDGPNIFFYKLLDSPISQKNNGWPKQFSKKMNDPIMILTWSTLLMMKIHEKAHEKGETLGAEGQKFFKKAILRDE